MKASVTQAVGQRPIAAAQELEALNNEVRPVLSAVRDVANHESRFKATTTTDSPGVYKRIWETDEVPTLGAWMIEARVVGVDDSGDCIGYVLRGLFQMTPTLVQQIGATGLAFNVRTVPAINVRFGFVDRTIYIEVVDDGTQLMRFSAVVIVSEVT